LTSSLADGQHTLTAQVEDLAGNISIFATPLIVKVKTTPPNVPTFDLDSASDARPYGHHTANIRNVGLAGITDANAVVQLQETGEFVTADAQGRFAFSGITLDHLGDYPFTVIATDLAGNTSQFARTITRSNAINTDFIRPYVTLSVSQPISHVGDQT